MRSFFESWLALELAILAALILAIGVGSFMAFEKARYSEESASHSSEVSSLARQLNNAAADAQASVRGYLLLGAPAYLSRYKAASDELSLLYRATLRLTTENPEQNGALKEIGPLIDGYQSSLQKLIDARPEHQQLHAELQSVLSLENDMRDQLESRLLGFIEVENGLLQERITLYRRNSNLTELMLVCGAALSLLLLAVGGFITWSEIRCREVAESVLLRSSLLLLDKSQVLQTTLDNMGRGWVRFTHDLHLKSWNDKFVSLLEIPAGSISAEWHISDLVRMCAARGQYGDRDVESVIAEATAAFQSDKPLCFELKRSQRMIEVHHNPIPGDGYVCTYADVTDRKRMEILKDAFVSTVSHELRTPLTAIRGALGLLAGGAVGTIPKKAKTMIDIAHTNCQRLARLTDDILDLEKIESGNIDMRFTVQPIHPLVEEAVREHLPFATERNVRFEIRNAAPGAQGRIDSDRFLQVLTNLLSNAVKYSPSNGIVTIATERRAGKTRIAVIDCGPGIPGAFHDKIFRKFVQADSSDSRSKGGSGLGLSLVKSLTEAMGGTVSFESTPGAGAAFFIDLPEAGLISLDDDRAVAA